MTAPRLLAEAFLYTVFTVNFASRSAARAAAAFWPTTFGTCCAGLSDPVAMDRRTTLPIGAFELPAGFSPTTEPAVPA